MEDRKKRDHITITRDQDCFTINLTTLSDLHLYIYIYSSNEKLYYDTCVIRILITRGTFVLFCLNVENHTRNPRRSVANKCCTYIGVGINYWVIWITCVSRVLCPWFIFTPPKMTTAIAMINHASFFKSKSERLLTINV